MFRLRRKSKDDTDKDKDKKKKKKKKKKKIDPNSRTFRFRKFLNSKLAKSSLGRKAIGHFLGEAGNTTLELIKAIVTKQVKFLIQITSPFHSKQKT